MPKVPISVCMITKNEEKKLERCLSSLAPYGFEIVIVDTGSTDRTKEIAAKYTDKIFHFEWINDFSAARNYSLQMASNNWIFMMDCDEWVETLNLDEMEYFRKTYPDAMGAVTRKNITNTPENPNLSTDYTERLFSRKKYYYTGIIHEQLTPKPGTSLENLLLETTIGHDGYCMSVKDKFEKAKRNLELLFQQMQKEPNNPYVYFQIGKTYYAINDYSKASLFYEQALSYNLDSNLSYVNTMVTEYGYSLLYSGQKEKALKLKDVYDDFAITANFVYMMGLIYMENHLYEEALDAFQKATTFETAGLNGANNILAYFQIGQILKMADEKEMAIKYFRLCPNYPDALKELQELGEI